MSGKISLSKVGMFLDQSEIFRLLLYAMKYLCYVTCAVFFVFNMLYFFSSQPFSSLAHVSVLILTIIAVTVLYFSSINTSASKKHENSLLREQNKFLNDQLKLWRRISGVQTTDSFSDKFQSFKKYDPKELELAKSKIAELEMNLASAANEHSQHALKLEQQVSASNRINKELNLKLSDKDRIALSLSQQNASLQDSLNQANSRLQEACSSVSKLMQVKADFEAQLNKSLKKRDSLSAQVSDLQASLNQVVSNLELTKEDVLRLTAEKEQMNTSLAAVNAQLEASRQYCASESTRLQGRIKTETEKSAAIPKLNAEIVQLKAELEVSNNELSAAKGKLQKRFCNVLAHDNAVENLTKAENEIAKLTADVSRLEAQILTLRSELSELQASLASKDLQIAALEKEILHRCDMLKHVTHQKLSSDTEVSRLNAVILEVRCELVRLANSETELKAQIRDRDEAILTQLCAIEGLTKRIEEQQSEPHISVSVDLQALKSEIVWYFSEEGSLFLLIAEILDLLDVYCKGKSEEFVCKLDSVMSEMVAKIDLTQSPDESKLAS